MITGSECGNAFEGLVVFQVKNSDGWLLHLLKPALPLQFVTPLGLASTLKTHHFRHKGNVAFIRDVGSVFRDVRESGDPRGARHG